MGAVIAGHDENDVRPREQFVIHGPRTVIREIEIVAAGDAAGTVRGGRAGIVVEGGGQHLDVVAALLGEDFAQVTLGHGRAAHVGGADEEDAHRWYSLAESMTDIVQVTLTTKTRQGFAKTVIRTQFKNLNVFIYYGVNRNIIYEN
jgi:hypothetical protein